jgi:tryptophan synthase alpha subunit
MSYVTAGYPTMEIAEKTIRALVDAGADLTEIGTPFSDTMGTVRQSSAPARCP